MITLRCGRFSVCVALGQRSDLPRPRKFEIRKEMRGFWSCAFRLVAVLLMAQLQVACVSSQEPVGKVSQQASVEAERSDESLPEPSQTILDPLAKRLCDVLYAIPAERKRQCCGATAVSSLADLCSRELSASVQRNAVKLDAMAIEECAVETERGLQGCGWLTPLLPPRPAACDQLIQGTLKDGADCKSSLECDDGLYCRGLSPARAGKCSAPAPARAACEIPADNLASFTGIRDDPRHPECLGRCIRNLCFPVQEAGAACSASDVCAAGIKCVSGRCEKPRARKLGEACDAKSPCEAGNTCQAGFCKPLKSVGESCSLPFECRALQCVKAPEAKTGTCGDPCAGTAIMPQNTPVSDTAPIP